MSNEISLIALWAALLGLHCGGGKSAYAYAAEGGYTGTEAEFSARLAALLNGTLLATVDESNRITVTGLLAGGDYTVSYRLEREDGTSEEVAIGSLTLGEASAELVNLLSLATNADGSAYNGGQGWKTGCRLSSSTGVESASSGIEVTGFMPVTYGQTITIDNITTADGGTNSICFYDSSHTYICGGFLQAALDESETAGSIVVNTDSFTNMTTAVAYFRFSATEITTDSVVTVTD